MATALHALPAQLEEDALLRVHQPRLARADAEECRVEHLDVVDHPACGHVGRIGAVFGADGRVERIGVEMADRVARLAQVLPERFDVGCAGEAPCHRSEEQPSEIKSLKRISYAVFCLKKKKNKTKDQ